MAVHFNVDGAIATIVIEGDNRMNACTYETYTLLEKHLFEDIDLNPEIKVGIIMGKGEHFSVGHDLKAAQKQIDEGEDKLVYGATPYYFNPFPRLITQRMYTPLIGATRGYCLAAALVFYGQHTSVRIAGESSKFGYTEIKRALIGASAMAQTTKQMPQALHMIMSATGEMLDAQTALRAGLVNEVVPDEQVERRARELAKIIARGSRVSVRAEKTLLLRGEGLPQSTAASLVATNSLLNTLDEALVRDMQQAING